MTIQEQRTKAITACLAHGISKDIVDANFIENETETETEVQGSIITAVLATGQWYDKSDEIIDAVYGKNTATINMGEVDWTTYVKRPLDAEFMKEEAV